MDSGGRRCRYQQLHVAKWWPFGTRSMGVRRSAKAPVALPLVQTESNGVLVGPVSSKVAV